VNGPAESRRIDHALDTTVTGTDGIELDAADVAMFASFDGRAEWIGITHEILRPEVLDQAPWVEFYQLRTDQAAGTVLCRGN
jgi:hypothetical protein